MIDPRILAALPKPQLPEGQRRVAEAILSRQPLKAPAATQAAPMWGEPMQLDPAQQDMFDGLSPADQMLWEDEYQRGVAPQQLYDMFNPSQRENMDDRGGMNRFNDAAAYQVAQADTGTMTDAAPQSYADRAAAANLDLNVTQAQRSGQALRLLQAEAVLRQLEETQGVRAGQRALEYLPNFVENMVIDDDYGRFTQARDAFAEAAMRADTGATINESEWPRILRNLMVQPGDSPERIAQRRAQRETIIQGLIGSSGEAAALMPEIGQPVVPVPNLNPQELSDEDLLRMLQGGQ
jgi:hypothetical protein